MCTRGFKAWRFRKRYYFLANRWDSYPQGLGQDIVATIPGNPKGYQTWLEEQRKLAAGWEAEWNDYLTVNPDEEVKQVATEMMAENHPTWFAPLNDFWIEWVYVIDLDREIFSVNNGAHFKLDEARHIDWMGALADGWLGDKIQLLPEEHVPSLLARTSVANNHPSWDASGDTSLGFENLAIDKVIHPTSISSSDQHANLLQSNSVVCRVVSPKNVADIPWRRRHEPILRSRLFWIWTTTLEDKLAATLLQWSPEDLPFREIAFAILCLVSGGKNIAILPNRSLPANKTLGKLGSEIISSLTAGAHVSDGATGSSPAETTYWLDGVLVFLTGQLYQPNAVELEVTRVAKYCHDNYPNDCVDAVIVSIEHVVLVHIIPQKEVQYSNIMPLINIENHLSMDARSRYNRSYLDKLAPTDDETDKEFKRRQRRKLKIAAKKGMVKNEDVLIHFGDTDDEDEEDNEDPALHLTTRGVGGDPSSTFFALVHLFDAAACRRMPPVKSKDGRFPNEIYASILTYVTDAETRINCMEISRLFRQLSQEAVLVTDNLIFGPCEAVESCVEADDHPNRYEVYDVASGERHKRCLRENGALSDFSGAPSLVVLIGTVRNRWSFLPDLHFILARIE